MKHVLFFSILFCVIALPTRAELTDADLDKIRLIVKEEVKAEVTSSEARIKQYVDLKIESVNGRIDGIEKQITWLMVIIVVAVGVPQIVIAWRSRKDRSLEKQIETLTQEIEILKQQRIVNP